MAKWSEWQKRVALWKKSGLSAGAFAAQNGLHPRTLVWWHSALTRKAKETPSEPLQFTRVVAAPSTSPPACSSIDVLLRSGTTVRVHTDFDPALLRAVLAALEPP